LVEVVCDTSFLIHIATKRIKNISNLETEIGSIQFVVPDIVIRELEKLSKNDKKKQHTISTLEFIKNVSITNYFITSFLKISYRIPRLSETLQDMGSLFL
jgi:rRNA-processing protein FCF1